MNSSGAVIATALRDPRNGLYKLQSDTLLHCSEISSDSMTFALSCSNDSPSITELWHRRLGHYHSQGLRRMIQSSAVKGLPRLAVTNSSCSTCLEGKQTRCSIPKQRATYSTKPLELVHTDIAGPFRIPSIGGSSYFLTFTDDFSRKTWIYFLRSKSDCIHKFKSFHPMVEKISGHRIVTLWSDNVGEYTSLAFQAYCSLHGIQRQYSQPYTPQHNGLAERKNWTLLNIVRCFLIESQLPSFLWAEAVQAACIIINLRPSKQRPDKTPDELFSGIKPDISRLRTFGATTYVFDTKPTKSKLDP